MSQIAQYRGTGKRKTSVARVILRPGTGATWFNGRTIEDYFPRATHRTSALAPLKIAANYVDVFTSYHELAGEAHCGSNTMYTPYDMPWWQR